LPLAAQAEAGNVLLIRGEWNRDFLAELETFPMGKFKDQVDAATRAFSDLVGPRRDASAVELRL
jgi:predicted phage terminase large subunit-like protein